MAAHHHVSFEVGDPSCVGEVRRAAVQLAESLGYDDVATGRVAIVANELANNLVRHAQGGRMLVGAVPGAGDETWVELLSVDRGPGIADVTACLTDGYSTGGTPGTGLGAVRRLSGGFDLYSAVPRGTVVLSRVAPASRAAIAPAPGAFAFAAVRVAAPGERVCGDNWSIRIDGATASLLVADGLGHGPQAQEAADAAVAVFDGARTAALPSQVLDQVHQALRSTRGAAVALVSAQATGGITFAGIGNIAGRIISGVGDRTLMSQHGTAGLQIRRIQDQVLDWPPHALLLLHSDGIVSRWHLDDTPDLLQHHPAVVAGWIMAHHFRGRDDATVAVLRRQFS